MIGPSTVPCGTPESTNVGVLLLVFFWFLFLLDSPSTIVLMVRAVKKLVSCIDP
jgi:hypothetical protein